MFSYKTTNLCNPVHSSSQALELQLFQGMKSTHDSQPEAETSVCCTKNMGLVQSAKTIQQGMGLQRYWFLQLECKAKWVDTIYGYYFITVGFHNTYDKTLYISM